MIGRHTWQPILALTLAAAFAAGCDDEPAVKLAPTATALAPAKPPAAEARKFTIDKASSKVEFMMEAPQEKIRGRVAGASEGQLQIDTTDIAKTTGLLTVDISGIELFQTKASDDGKFGVEEKSDLQNEHARAWLEIGPDAPEDVKKKNSRAEFSIIKIEKASSTNVDKLAGDVRKVTFTAVGEFLLHGRKTTKAADLEATFKYADGKPVSVTVITVKPFPIGLDEHDVKPREAFGKLAAKTLEILAPKVAKEALVSFELTAALGQGSAPVAPPPAYPAASAEKK